MKLQAMSESIRMEGLKRIEDLLKQFEQEYLSEVISGFEYTG